VPGAAAAGAQEEYILRSSSGLTVRVRLRIPPGMRASAPAAVILGGLQRGREAVDVAARVVGETPIVLAALDYPYDGDPEPRGWAILGALREARPALYRTIAAARLLVDFLARDPRIRPDRILVIGVSLGAPAAVVVGGADRRVAGVAGLFGADLPAMLGQAVGPRAALGRGAVVALAAWHFAAVDARRYAAAIPPRPFLVVGGRGDRRIPPEAVEALAAAGAPTARLVWLDAPHPNPTNSDWLRLSGDAVRAWLAEQRLLD
jgi:dienelactone hydrolase